MLKFSNLSVLHKGLLMQDWEFRLGEKDEFKNERSHFMDDLYQCRLEIES